mgnify:CR=1 FL=1
MRYLSFFIPGDQSLNWTSIEILIQINLKKTLKLNFLEKSGLHDDLKIIWKKKLTPGLYRVPTLVQTKKNRAQNIKKTYPPASPKREKVTKNIKFSYFRRSIFFYNFLVFFTFSRISLKFQDFKNSIKCKNKVIFLLIFISVDFKFSVINHSVTSRVATYAQATNHRRGFRVKSEINLTRKNI